MAFKPGRILRAAGVGAGVALVWLAFFRHQIDGSAADRTWSGADAAGASSAQPIHPALAVLSAEDVVAVTLSGSGFGLPDASTRLEVLSDGTWVPIASTASCVAGAESWCILIWKDEEIVAKLPSWARGCRLRVRTTQGASEVVPVYEYTYDWFETNADWCQSPGTNPHPVAVATDASGRVWINEEFHTEFKVFDPASGVVSSLPIGHPAEGPFASTLFGDHATHTSQWGEDIVVDPRGRVWLSEAGCPWCDTVHPNHSRVVMYDPALRAARVYNLPGNANGAGGLAYETDYEPGHDRVWVTQLARGRRGIGITWAHLVWFDPERAPFDDGTFDFAVEPADGCTEKTCPASQESCDSDEDCRPTCRNGECPDGSRCAADDECMTCCLDVATCPVLGRCPDGTARDCLADPQCLPVCGPGTCRGVGDRRCFTDDDCSQVRQACAAPSDAGDCLYHEYELPGVTVAGHVTIGRDRWVWFTGYWSDSEIGRLDPQTGAVQMFPLATPRCQVPQIALLGAAPWEIAVAANGDIVVGEYGDSDVDRFDFRRRDDPACQQLRGEPPWAFNECIAEIHVPGVALESQTLHSLAFDRHQNLWFTQSGRPDDPQAMISLGYVKRDWSAVVLLHGLSNFPCVAGQEAPTPHDAAVGPGLTPAAVGAALESNSSYFAHAWDLPTPGARAADLCGPVAGDVPSQEPGTRPASASCTFEGSGIAVDDATGDIWFGDYRRQRLGRLRPLRTNVALGQSATQSSAFEGRGAERAVDGNVDGDAAHGSVAETADELGSWWAVDLGDLWRIDQIELSNRTDCCADALRDFYVLVSDLPFGSDDLAEAIAQPGVTAHYHEGSAGRSTWIDIARSGRYVRVQLAGGGRLALAEVVVLGGPMPACDPKTAQVDCDDGNACTADACREGRCESRCRVGGEGGESTPAAAPRCVANRGSCECASCAGDCNCDGEVSVDDLLIGIGIGLGTDAPTACPSLDVDGDDRVRVHELIAAVSRALVGCPAAPR